jgi:hypothetical protein
VAHLESPRLDRLGVALPKCSFALRFVAIRMFHSTLVGQGPHLVDTLSPDLCGDNPARPAPPEPHRLMADLDAEFVQMILDVAQQARVTDIEHDRQADDFGTGIEVPGSGDIGHLTRLGDSPFLLKEPALTTPQDVARADAKLAVLLLV